MGNYRPHDEPVAGYRLLELLGEGAFGSVWKAEGPGGVLVALKIISKLNGMHAIREWQSLQAVKNLKHSNLVNIYGVWLKNEQGHVLSTEEVQALIPAEVERPAAVTATAPVMAPPTPPPRRSAAKRRSGAEPNAADVRYETLQVGATPSSSPPLDSAGSETSSASGTDSAKGTDSAGGADSAGSAGSASSEQSAGSAGSRERWARIGDKLPPLELVTAMTLGDGTLLDRLKRCQAAGQRGIPRAELLEHLRDAVKGLQYLNDHDVQHCDVKPENLLVVGGSVQVCDYGSALRAIYAAEARTSQGYTEQYAAPEQLGAKKVKVHKSTDLYALAITYYALRTGKFPWSDSAEEPIPVLKYGEKFDFSALARLTRYRYERDVLRRALKRDPKDRQRSVSAFLSEIESALVLESQAEAAVRRRWRRMAALAAMLLLVVGLGAAGFHFRDRFLSLLRQSSDHERLALLLSENQWDQAFALVENSTELTKDGPATERTQGQLVTAMRRLASEPGQTDTTILDEALQVKGKLLGPDLAKLIVQTVLEPELGRGEFAAAAASVQAAPLPPELRQRAEQEVFERWRPAAEAKQPATAATAELAAMASALPAYRAEIGPIVEQKLSAGIAAADAALSERSSADWQQLADDCRVLAETAAQAASFHPACGPLAFEARLRGLAARVQQREPSEVKSEVEALASDLANAGLHNNQQTSRVALLAEYADSGNRLSKRAMQEVARLGPALQVTPAKLQAGKPWDVFLYRQLLQATFAAAAANLSDIDEGTLAALRELPAEGGADLQIAQALLVQASRTGAEADLARARKWLAESTSLKDQAQVSAKKALSAWLALADNGWFDAKLLAATIDTLSQWREGSQAPLADASLVQVLTALVARAEQQASGTDGAALLKSIEAACSVLDPLAATDAAAGAPFQHTILEAADNLHRLRLRSAGVGITQQALPMIADDLAAIEAGRAKSSATSASRQLPPLVHPLDELELAALTIESYLLLGQSGERPPAVTAAWERLRQAPPAAVDAAPKYDGDYISYVRDLASCRGFEEPQPAALERQAASTSPWLAAPLRRSTAAAELLARNVGQLALPADLLFADQAAPAFKAAAQRLDAVRAWDPSQPAVVAWLPICRMYEQAGPDWAAIASLTAAASADPPSLASLKPPERLHLLLARGRAMNHTASDQAGRLAALAAFAAIVRDPAIFDPYGSPGPVSPSACYAQIIEPASALLPASLDELPAEERAAAAAIRGAAGSLLEGDFARDLAATYFEYPKQPLAFVEATRDAFRDAARLEPDSELRLRWITGQARAEDLLLSRVSEEVPAEQFRPLTELAASVQSSWPETFEASALAGIAEHYRSRVVANPKERESLLARASGLLDKAHAALVSHPRADSPWCQGWLSQCRESLSKIALEQSHLQPWGLEKQRLLKLAVKRAEEAEQVDVKYRVSPASCLLCAGNAYEDLAVHLFCVENFEPAEKKFKAAVNVQIDPLSLRQSQAFLGRLLVRRAVLDPTIANNPVKAAECQKEAVRLLEGVSENLREGRYRDLGLAQEADYYLAEAYLRFQKDAAKAEALYKKIALEAKSGSYDRIDCLMNAATCRVLQEPTDALAKPAFYMHLAGDLDAIERELGPDSDPNFRVQLLKLRFKSATSLIQRKAIADPHLAALENQPGDEPLLARCKILLSQANTRRSKSEIKDALEELKARQELAAQCGELAGQVKNVEERLTTEFQALSLLQTLYLAAAAEADQEALKVASAEQSLEVAKSALLVAAQVGKLQETVWCTPTLQKQKFDTLTATLPVRRGGLAPVEILLGFETKHQRQLKQAQDQVRSWWIFQDAAGKEVNLLKIPESAGGPTETEKRKFREHIGA